MEPPTRSSSPVRFWQPQWWIPDFDDETRRESVERIAAGASPSPTYYLLLVLSTLIAGYGLLSNSTATVIGAMIVAPLMGPILGLAMSIVIGEARLFRSSLIAEISGVVVVVLTALFVAQVTGVSQIDFAASEIANRTRPTLFDLAIGLAAGLAGAFCLIHPALQASVAGVAIAVALVPPLAVTGITLAGWLHGQLSYWPAFGSFMLFLANFLTIELAAGLLFTAAGFRTRRDLGGAAIRRTIVIQLLLLLATGLFLSQQLRNLVRERLGLSTARQVLLASLRSIPGAELDSVKAELLGKRLEVVAVVGSRTEISPEAVTEMEVQIREALGPQLADNEFRLIVRTVSSTYASSSGLLYEPQSAPPSPEQVRAQFLETALRGVMSGYPNVELSSYRLLPGTEGGDVEGSSVPLRIELTLRSPYVFTPRLVAELQQRLDKSLSKQAVFRGETSKLLVRTVTVLSATADDLVTIDAPGSALTQEQRELKSLLTDSATQFQNQEVVHVSVRPLLEPEATLQGTGEQPLRYAASIQLFGDKILTRTEIESWQEAIEQDFQAKHGKILLLDLEVQSQLGRRLYLKALDSASPETISKLTKDAQTDRELSSELAALISSQARGRLLLETFTVVRGPTDGDVRIEAVVVSPQPLTNQQVLGWQKKLKSRHPELSSLELALDNRLGKTLELVPSR
jgi:uncharacterized hydrophobic protein (TIGR00271 family)